MRYLFEKGSFRLYEVDDDDLDVCGVAGNHYSRNAVLLFDADETVFELGREKAWARSEKEAIMLAEQIDEGRRRVPFAVQAELAEKAVRDKRRTDASRRRVEISRRARRRAEEILGELERQASDDEK